MKLMIEPISCCFSYSGVFRYDPLRSFDELSRQLHEDDKAGSYRLNRGTEPMIRASVSNRFEKWLLDEIRSGK